MIIYDLKHLEVMAKDTRILKGGNHYGYGDVTYHISNIHQGATSLAIATSYWGNAISLALAYNMVNPPS